MKPDPRHQFDHRSLPEYLQVEQRPPANLRAGLGIVVGTGLLFWLLAAVVLSRHG